MSSSRHSLGIPAAITDLEVRGFLTRIVEQIDTINGNSGPKKKTATLEEVKNAQLNSSVGINKENNVTVLLERIKALEHRVEVLENEQS